MELSADALIAGCADDSFDAGVTIRSALEPLAGPGAPIKPAVYEGGTYQVERRWWGVDDVRIVDAIVIDNEASQANRCEQALKAHRPKLGLPEMLIDLAGVETLPPHLPPSLSSFDLPHRNGDSYLRDAMLDGTKFPRTKIGQQIFAATDRDPSALFEWMPQALVYGFWQSHLGKKRQQSKMARAWSSTIVGYDPAATENTVRGLKGDPLNLSISEGVLVGDDDEIEWNLTSDAKAKAKKSGDSLAEIGHGQVPVASKAGSISFAAIEQRATISFARLRTITCGSADANAAGRALLAAIALAAHTFAFGRATSLRSGCELRTSGSSWTWLGGDADETVDVLKADQAVALVQECAARAAAVGLPVGPSWQTDPLILTPNAELTKVIASAWPLAWPAVEVA